jgi:NAD dependent epimerase/dehydratase family enzyme
MGRVLNRPAVIPVPAFLLKLALGPQSELLLDGRRAVPERLRATGYQFRFGGLREALEDLLRDR